MSKGKTQRVVANGKSRSLIQDRGIRVNAYSVLHHAVEQGIALGWSRAHKHNDKPSPEELQDYILDNIMSSACEWFRFDDDRDLG